MLLNKDVLLALQQKLHTKSPNFNIHIFLLLLQITTRPMGYPPYEQGINADYYLELIHRNIERASSLKNSHHLQTQYHSLFQILICFCYFQDTLGSHRVDKELYDLLVKAIEERMDTTDEERCAEKSLLAMFLQRSKPLLILIADYYEQLIYVNLQERLKDKIATLWNRRIKQQFSTIADTTPLNEALLLASSTLQIVQSAEVGLKHLEVFTAGTQRKFCQGVIGNYLVTTFQSPLTETWVANRPFLMAAVKYALQENGKKELRSYIGARSREGDCFSLLRRFPKATKLNSANKFFRALDNERDVVFSQQELDALQHDDESRLTELYLRYQSVAGNLKLNL